MTATPGRTGITCLGCGLLCDDVTVSVANGRASDMAPTCPLGAAWLEAGVVPNCIRSGRDDIALDAAIDAAATLLAGARGRLLVYLGPGLTVEALKPAVAIADGLQAVVDTATSAAAASGILAGQRRGRAAATLGELRNRADLVIFWGVNTERTHPRLVERLVDAAGTHIPGGRSGRTVVRVRIGTDGSPDADSTLRVPASAELAALSHLRSIVGGRTAPAAAAAIAGLPELAAQLVAARYVAIVASGESADAQRPAQRAEGLIALAQALNGPTRAVLYTLRSGDNRNGIESLLTWQTGFPFAVDFRSGVPEYAVDRRGLDDIASVDAALVVGDWRAIPSTALASLESVPTVVVGPAASEAPFVPRIAMDTGRAGLHEGGTAYRMDDVPLSLTAALDGPRSAIMVLSALYETLGRRLGRVPA